MRDGGVYTGWAEPPPWASVLPRGGTTGRAALLCAGPVERELGGPSRGFVLVINLASGLKRDVRFASLCHIRPL